MTREVVANEKWILTVRELHLGHCKETFRAGAVIELDELRNQLIIDGRRFDDTRDLDVLKRHDMKFPDNPWLIPYSKEGRAAIMQGKIAAAPAARPLQKDQQLQVIQSDEDLNEPIDIRDTQISRVHAAEKEAIRVKVKTNGMEIIRGDETVEERIASLKGKTDMGSIAERARLKASGSVKMAVVKDDSLGAGFTGKNAVSMNAGQHLPSREEAESKSEDARAYADARKQEADKRRKANMVEIEGNIEQQSELLDTTPEPAQKVGEAEAKLRAENDDLKSRLEKLEKMMIAQQGAAPKRGRKPKAATVEG